MGRNTLQSVIPDDAYVMIIGAMKSGTTSLFRYLDAHPRICLSSPKETNFFSQKGRTDLPLSEYEQFWAFKPEQHSYALEASTNYTKYEEFPGVPEKIKNAGLKPKFIYIMRDPAERIRSDFHHLNARYTLWGHTDILSARYLQRSNYYRQISEYLAVFPKEDILTLQYESFIESPDVMLDQVYEFLDLEKGFYPDTFKVANAARRDGSFAFRLGRSSLAKRMPEPLRLEIQKLLNMIRPAPAYPDLTDSQRQTIFETLKDDMSALQRELDVDIKRWGY